MITKDEWITIAEELKGLYGLVKFRLDGREVVVQKQTISENRMGLVVYVDGHLYLDAGSKISEHYDPITEKVWRKVLHHFDPYRKARKSKRLKSHLPPKSDPVVILQPIFYTAKSFVNHFKKIENLERIKDE